MRQIGHWTPRYIYDRLSQLAYQRRNPDAPWFGREMVKFLEEWLLPDDRGFEWGSGRSTMWFAKRIGSLVSVEHNREWSRWVGRELKTHGVKNVKYHICEDKSEYCAVANEYPSESFDFCLIDGVLRDECALAAISLVKQGGILIVDDFNRYLPTETRSPFSRRHEDGPATARWALYLDCVRSWRKIRTTNGITDSGFWVKPMSKGQLNQGANCEEELSIKNRHRSVLASNS